jgi:flagellar biogenesis protein FliO
MHPGSDNTVVGNSALRGIRLFIPLILFLPVLSASADSTGATNLTAFPNALPDMGGSVLRVLGALILVVSLFLGGVWLFRNWQRLALRKGGVPKLNVLEVKSLGQRQAIYVVGYQQQRMLLASSPAGITLVSHLPAVGEDEIAAPPAALNFSEALQQVLSRK